MSDLEGIRMFIGVVEQGSYSAAAKQLKVSKSHVSRQISELENRLGAQLLNRTTRKVAMTENGAAYFEQCKSAINHILEAEKALMEQQQTPLGTLRLTVAAGFGERYIVPAATDFMKRYPQLHVSINFTNRNVDLVTEGYDLAIRAGTLQSSTLIARRIASRRLHICASPDYFAKYGKPNAIVELKKHNCLVGSLSTWRFRIEHGDHADIRVEGNWHSNNGYALLHAALNGIGIAQLPEFYVQEELKRGRLETAMAQFQPRDTGVWAVYPSNRHLTPKVKMFVDFLAERFRQIDYL